VHSGGRTLATIRPFVVPRAAGRLRRRGGSAEPAEQQYSLCILPWLSLGAPVTFADVRLETWSPRALRCPTYLSYRPQVNATHFARVYQKLHAWDGDSRPHPQTPRRPHYFCRPPPRRPHRNRPCRGRRTGTPSFEPPFLDALATCVENDDDASVLIRQSLPLFLQGSELDELETHGQDVVWIASSRAAVRRVRPQQRHQDGRQDHPDARRRVGRAAGTASPPLAARVLRQAQRDPRRGGNDRALALLGAALIGTVLYVALVKHLLADVGRYGLSDRDRNDANVQ
jgi:hypothetical protein